MQSVQRVLIITNIPNPYRIPLFNEVHNRLAEKNIHLKVAFGSKSYSRRKFVLNESDMKFDFEILSSKSFHFGNNEKTFFTYSGLLKLINHYKPDVIVTNGYALSTIKIWMRSFFTKTKYIIWTGSIKKAGVNDSILRKWQRKLLMCRCAGYIVYGTKALENLVEQGAAPQKISVAVNTVDTNYFFKETYKLRNENSSDSKKHLTYLGYLVKRKNSIQLLHAIKILSAQRNDFVLDIIGDGDDKINLEKYIAANNLNTHVIFHGFRQKNELPLFLAKSSCFLFQTDFDIWGLVLNEAMAAGIPCLASVNAGASFDLVEDGINGFIVNFDEQNVVSDKINWLLNHPFEAAQMGNNAAKFISENATIGESAKGFIHAIINY